MERYSSVCQMDVSFCLCYSWKISLAAKINAWHRSWWCPPLPTSLCWSWASWTCPRTSSCRGIWRSKRQSRPSTTNRTFPRWSWQHSTGGGRRCHVPQRSGSFHGCTSTPSKPPFTSFREWHLVAITRSIFSRTASFIKMISLLLAPDFYVNYPDWSHLRPINNGLKHINLPILNCSSFKKFKTGSNTALWKKFKF